MRCCPASARRRPWRSPSATRNGLHRALWRRELRNVLATLMRVRQLPLDRALAAFAAAEALVTDATVEPSTEECLRLAARGRVSAWDAEFVFVAEAVGLPLVTADRRLARAFPGRVVPLEDLPLEK